MGRPQTTFSKRQREQAKRERKQLKAEKRAKRKAEGIPDDPDEMIVGGETAGDDTESGETTEPTE